jgi:hypothetical protein
LAALICSGSGTRTAGIGFVPLQAASTC